MNAHHPSLKAKLLIFVGLLIIFWVWTSFSAQDIFERAIPKLQFSLEQNRGFVTALFMGLAALSVLLGPFTSVFLIPPAVAVWGAERTLVLLLSGWIVGNVVSYAIGRFIGFSLVARLVSHEKIEVWLAHIRRAGTFARALIFRVALPAETGYLFGLVKYNFPQYLSITLLAEIPFALVAVYAGEAFFLGDFFVFAGWIASGFALIVFAGYIFKKEWSRS